MRYTVEKAERDINVLEEAIRTIEEFVIEARALPEETPEQKAIKYYAHCGRVVEVANKLNEEGYKIDGRKWISNDVSTLIDQPTKDEFMKKLRENLENSDRFQKVVWKK